MLVVEVLEVVFGVELVLLVSDVELLDEVCAEEVRVNEVVEGPPLEQDVGTVKSST